MDNLFEDSKYKSLHLDPGEHVIFEVRKHWIIFVGNIISFFFLAFLPAVVYMALITFVAPVAVFLFAHFSTFLFFYILWILFLWINFFLIWTKYFLDVWYVTGSRIIDIEQKRIFYRTVSNLRFDKIQDITVEVPGFLATFLNYGNIRVQTASEDSVDFFLATVKDPNHVKEVIFNQHNNVVNKTSL